MKETTRVHISYTSYATYEFEISIRGDEWYHADEVYVSGAALTLPLDKEANIELEREKIRYELTEGDEFHIEL